VPRSKSKKLVREDGELIAGRTGSSKLVLLEHIFKRKHKPGELQKNISFTLDDLKEAYRECYPGKERPSSISNTILDLTRKRKPIHYRLPKSIYSLNYDITKRTGPETVGGEKYAGEFVHFDTGEMLEQWLIWPNDENTQRVTLSSSLVASQVLNLIRKDEGGLLSIIDHTDALSQIINGTASTIVRVQNPMKWQPNEIDGFYVSRLNSSDIVYPIEAKALSTKDDVNLIQMRGGIKTLCEKLESEHPGKYSIIPIAVQGVKNGFKIAVFESTLTSKDTASAYEPILSKAVEVTFEPEIRNWT
jgi:hypothetical protein